MPTASNTDIYAVGVPEEERNNDAFRPTGPGFAENALVNRVFSACGRDILGNMIAGKRDYSLGALRRSAGCDTTHCDVAAVWSDQRWQHPYEDDCTGDFL